MSDPNELESLKQQVWDSYPSLILLEMDAALPFPEGATAAIFRRLAKAWEDPEALRHALRGISMTEEEAVETDSVAQIG